mmetsp:Transcript_36725/g.63077  ORF Transcript_36725/g.63077 Transcript_36725/m.63077 type:complete len:218 (+) Transcript_36725:268-921(+)
MHGAREVVAGVQRVRCNSRRPGKADLSHSQGHNDLRPHAFRPHEYERSARDREPALRGLCGQLDVPDEAEALEEGDGGVGDVKLPRPEAVARRVFEGVVVVVPALAKGQPTNPPVVARLVARHVVLRAPHVRGRVDEPCDVVEEGRGECSPAERGETADGVEERKVQRYVQHVPVLEMAVNGLLREVGGVAAVAAAGLVDLRIEHPAEVRPVEAFVR